MVTKVGRSYANLFVSYIENQFFNQFNGTKPELYGRYIDEISETSIAFLDIKVLINSSGLSTSVHYKLTDSHSYLLPSSSHPSHVKNSIPFSQFLKLRRLCSDDSDFSNKSEEMHHFFKKRGYPDSVASRAQYRIQQIDRKHVTEGKERENSIYTHLPST